MIHDTKSRTGCGWLDPCALFVCFQAKQQAHMRAHIAEECKNDYAAQLQKFNKEQNQFYFSDMPLIFNVSKSLTVARLRLLQEHSCN